MNLDFDILNSIQYHTEEERRFWLQEYVKKITGRICITPINYGFCGARNGGFSSQIRGFFDYKGNLHPIYHLSFSSKILCENIYIEFDAFRLLEKVLNIDCCSYNGKMYEFLSIFHNSILDICKIHHIKPTSKFRGLMLKKYTKDRCIPRYVAIQMAIELITIKAKFKKNTIW